VLQVDFPDVTRFFLDIYVFGVINLLEVLDILLVGIIGLVVGILLFGVIGPIVGIIGLVPGILLFGVIGPILGPIVRSLFREDTKILLFEIDETFRAILTLGGGRNSRKRYQRGQE
jgi:hypothetical protein